MDDASQKTTSVTTDTMSDVLPQAQEPVDRANFTCNVCLDLAYEPVTFKCTHRFCRVCAVDWSDISATCPTCRQGFKKDEITSIDTDAMETMQLHFADEYAAMANNVPERLRVRREKIAERSRIEQKLKRDIARIKQHFTDGHRMEDDTVNVLLEMHGGNVDQTIAFLSMDNLPRDEQRDLVTLAQVDSGSLKIPRDFYDNATPLPNHTDTHNTDNGTTTTATPLPGSNRDIVGVLLSPTSTYTDHYRIQTEHTANFKNILKFFQERHVLSSMRTGAKTRALACCWTRRDRELSNLLLSSGVTNGDQHKPDIFGIPEILKAIKLLDSGRLLRQKTKQLARLEQQGNCTKSKIGKLKCEIESLGKEDVTPGSLSGSLTKFVGAAIAIIPKAKLEYYALIMPTAPWKELCDLLHINPTKGTTCDWFLQFVHGVEAPPTSMVQVANRLTDRNSADLLQQTPLPYSVVRTKLPHLPVSGKVVVASYMPLDQLLWWYEDLTIGGGALDEMVLCKIKNGEVPTLPYGKLMERLMLFERSGRKKLFDALLPFAEEALRAIRLNIDRPVAVLGDASFSMDVAIRTATILSSLMAAISQAELVFFHTEVSHPEQVPNTAETCIKVAKNTKTLGQTAPASALWEYYTSKKVVKCFVVVSDEGENLKSNGFYFHELYRKYHAEIYPAKLVFVSFLDANEKGQMAQAVQRMGYEVVNFAFDKLRPDLTKLDALLGTLAVVGLNT
eukprot:m.119345 g.119345  ORF g.119345 m.119345 type:complete len:732 (+) comp28729_c0_seq1:180-2375(+)